MTKWSAFSVASLLFMVLTGCSNIPKQITTAPLNDLQLSKVRDQVENFQNQQVRWGGEVVSVENNNDVSLVQIVQYPLNNYGKPVTTKSSEGRFIAKTDEFIDPVVFKEGTLLTFTGIVDGETVRKIDQKELTMPVINVTYMYRWQIYPTVQRDLFYDPFYYNGFYPYHGYYDRFWYHPRFGYRYY